MSENSRIEWTDATWNPIIATRLDTGKRGWHCEKVNLPSKAPSACDNCYAAAMNKRSDGLVGIGTGLNYAPDSLPKVAISIHEKTLLAPLRWKRPRKIFVCSMTDLFGRWVPDAIIDRVFAVMALCPQHTFQVLTKRPDRVTRWARAYKGTQECPTSIEFRIKNGTRFTMPLSNVWIGVTAESQEAWDLRVPVLRQVPAAVRFVSVEPMLGPMTNLDLTGIDWVIVGGESGKKARPMHPDWARSLRDQCQAAGVAFHFKQWGEWEIASHANGHLDDDMRTNGAKWVGVDGAVDGLSSNHLQSPIAMIRVGKKSAGRLLDGREWNEFPAVQR